MDLRTYIDNAPRGTLSRLAEAVGLAPSYIYDYKILRRMPPTKVARAIEIATEGYVSEDDMIAASEARGDVSDSKLDPATVADEETPHAA